MSMTLGQIAELVEGQLVGDGSIPIHGVGALETAGAGEIAPLHAERLLDAARASSASAFLVNPELAAEIQTAHVIVALPQAALNRVIDELDLCPGPDQKGVHPTAVVHPDARLADDVAVGPFAVIDADAEIGAGTRIRPQVVIERGARIGERCVIHPHAFICSQARIGNDVVIGASAVIGAEGFGFEIGPAGSIRLRHIGTVEIGDRAELGSGTTIDRARFGATRIENDVKIDSQVHIGHNCSVGQHTHLSAQVGVAGSTKIGQQCMLGGQVGLADHITIADKTSIGAKSGVGGDLPDGGKYFGFWAKDAAVALREVAALAKLPAALKELKNLRDEVERLRARLGEHSDGAAG